MQKPSVGRVVHYHSYGTPGGEYKSEPRAAIVTQANVPTKADPFGEETTVVHLCVLNPEGLFFNRFVNYSEEPKPGHWSWPPRVG